MKVEVTHMTKIELRSKANDEADSHPLDLWAQTDRLFQDLQARFASGFGSPWLAVESPALHGPVLPSFDVEDQGAVYALHVDLPGVSKEQVDVRVIGNSVHLRAAGSQEKEESGKNFLRRERSWRGLDRSVELPEAVRADEVSAKLDKGVLTVTVPKAQPDTERKVPVL